MEWLTKHWIEITAALYACESLIAAIAPMTPWKFDDNLAGFLSKILAKFFPKKEN